MTEPLNLDDLPTADDVRNLTAEVARQRRFGKWNRRLIYTLTAVVIAVLVLGLFTWRLSAYAVCSTNRAQALSGPGNERINLFFQAYTEAAGDKRPPLTAARKDRLLDGLDEARVEFSLIPARSVLVKRPDGQLRGLRDLVASLRANKAYAQAFDTHPVCSLWSM